MQSKENTTKHELADLFSKQHSLLPTVDDITNGKDITEHYLGEVNKKFKIYRFNQGVYAVRFDEQTSNPMDFVHMWNSHKGEQRVFAEQGQKLGSGNCGNVYQKTEDKAYKVISGKQKNIKINIENNFIILEQKFLLKEHGIEKYFILGLWTLKDNGNLIMPKVNRIYITKDKLKPMFDEFIFALKKLNELGYSHPDLAAELWHISPQNMLITSEGIRLIDIDPGLFHYQEFANSPVYADSRDKFIIDGQDQWIYVYNDMYARQESSGQRVRWRPELNTIVSLPRYKFWDIQVPRIHSPTRQVCLRRPWTSWSPLILIPLRGSKSALPND